MLRIVGLHHGDTPDDEFILLQNQGSIRVKLKGHALISEGKFTRCSESASSYAFPDQEHIPPGHFVLLRSNDGIPRWGVSKDGSRVYFTFAGASETLWPEAEGPVHVLHIQHTYIERKAPTGSHEDR